jgi:hypothetical protein
MCTNSNASSRTASVAPPPLSPDEGPSLSLYSTNTEQIREGVFVGLDGAIESKIGRFHFRPDGTLIVEENEIRRDYEQEGPERMVSIMSGSFAPLPGKDGVMF